MQTNTPLKSSGFGFGATTDQKPAGEAPKPVFGSAFGSNSAPVPAPDLNKTSIFGAASNTTTPSSTPFLFGAQATSNQAPPPSYQQPAPPLSGTSSGFNTPVPSTNIFGSVNNSSPSVFGQSASLAGNNTDNKLPAFGATNAFGNQSPFGASVGTARTASSASSPFGSGGDNDEPNNKKLNTGGFQFNATGPNTTSTGSSGAVSV